jgi:hypothetical protein
MSAISSQRRVSQRTEEERSALQPKIMDRTVIAERNVVRSDIMVPPLDVFMRLSRLTTRDTSTPVPASSSPGWSDSSMRT